MAGRLLKSLSASYDSSAIVPPLLLLVITLLIIGSRKLPFRTSGGDSAPTSANLCVETSVAVKNSKYNKNNEFGVWNPVKFQYPPIEACPQEVGSIKPIPYRPFRWGAYHVTMGIRSMAWNDWIELDRGFNRYHRIKSQRIQTHGSNVIQVLGDDANPGVVRGGGEAAIELVHELAEYLTCRYPKQFHVIRQKGHTSIFTSDASWCEPGGSKGFCDWGWNSKPPIQVVTITSLNVSYALPLSVEDGERAPERALEIAALLIQDDLALMIEGADGRYYFQAGAICLPGFWRMRDKIGMPLDEIHISGNVPQYKERLGTSLERFFRRLPVEKPVMRNNYFIQTNQDGRGSEVDPEELAWAESTLGREEEYAHSPQESGSGRAVSVVPTNTEVKDIRLRSERQTLRRLPQSGAVVFTIRTYLFDVVDIAQETGVPGRMASALRSWPEDVGEYKGKTRGGWWSPLLAYLDGCHERQLKFGEHQGREEGYPF